MAAELVFATDAVSAVAAVTLVYSTFKPCKLSGVQYLLGVPAGFGLVAIGFFTSILGLLADSNEPVTLVMGIFSFLTLTYGLLFISLTYARRTRFRIVGESIILEIAIPSIITIWAVTYVIVSHEFASASIIVSSLEIPLRCVMALAALYVFYEAERSWRFTQKASEGIVAVAFAFLFVEQIGFILAAQGFGEIASFVGYEGRILGLLILIAVTTFGTAKGNYTLVLRRLGLTAPAH